MFVQGSDKFKQSMNQIFQEPKTVKIIEKIIPARLDGRNDEDIKYYRDFIDTQIRQGNVDVNKSKVKMILTKKLRKKNIKIPYFGFCVVLKNPMIVTYD